MKRKCLCAITVKSCPLFSQVSVLFICTVKKIMNIAVVFSDVTECSGSDRRGSIKPFACKGFVQLCAFYRKGGKLDITRFSPICADQISFYFQIVFRAAVINLPFIPSTNWQFCLQKGEKLFKKCLSLFPVGVLWSNIRCLFIHSKQNAQFARIWNKNPANFPIKRSWNLEIPCQFFRFRKYLTVLTNTYQHL